MVVTSLSVALTIVQENKSFKVTLTVKEGMTYSTLSFENNHNGN
jgi:hypothetical protein